MRLKTTVALSISLLAISFSVAAQKIGVKYGWTSSLVFDETLDSKEKASGRYLGVEYEVSTWKLWPVTSEFNRWGEERNLVRLYFLIELALVQTNFKNVIISPNSPGLDGEFTYVRFSPRYKIWDYPKKDYDCRVIGCCDGDDYGKLKPYFNFYLGPKIDFLVNQSVTNEITSDKTVFGGVMSLNTQLICMSSGSIYCDLQFIVDGNETSMGGHGIINTSAVFTIGFKLRNMDNY